MRVIFLKRVRPLIVFSIFLLSACGQVGTATLLGSYGGLENNPAANLSSLGNSATGTTDKDEERENNSPSEVIEFDDGSTIILDANVNIIESDTPTTSLAINSNRTAPDSNSYAYVPESENIDNESNFPQDPSSFEDFDDSENSWDATENSNQLDVNNEENFENNTDLSGDPVDELAHIPAPIAKTGPFIPNSNNDDSETTDDDAPDENNDCGDDNENTIIIDDESEGENLNGLSVSVTDCGDDEENQEDDPELMIIQTQQNPSTGKWETSDDYVIISAEHNPHGKTRFQIDPLLLTPSDSNTGQKSTRSRTHFILRRH